MKWLRRHRETRDRDIARELQDHLDLETEELVERGRPADEARTAARRLFGNPTMVAEDLRALHGTPHLERLAQDVRYGLRTLRRSPGVTAIAIGSAALGIGTCAVMFSILNTALFRPLPVQDPSRLVSISEHDRSSGEIGGELSYPDFLDLRQARTLDGLAACDALFAAAIGPPGDLERHWGALVTANYFAVVRPGFAAGRGFDPERDDTPGRAPVVVLSHDLWQSRFAGDPDIVGRVIAVNRRSATVIGVTAKGYRGTGVGYASAFWIPFSMLDEVESRQGPVSQNRGRFWLDAVGRLGPGVEIAAARAELDAMAVRLNAASGRESRGFFVERAGRLDHRVRQMATAVLSLSLGATALVLLTACANVANLLMARASARRREIAARMALGASRGRVIRQLLTESLLLGLAGGAGGWAIAVYGTSLVGLLRVPLGLPFDLAIAIDARVVLFAIALSMTTGVAFGLVPALRATRMDGAPDLRLDAHGVTSPERVGIRSSLVVAQVAICTVLLVGTGLFVRSLQTARALDLGMRERDLLLLSFEPGLDRRSDPRARQLIGEILDRARAVPGVASATVTTAVPLTFIVNNSNFRPEEPHADGTRPRTHADIYAVGSGFFETLGLPFVAGQDFPAASPGRGVAIVNEAFAQAMFAGRPAMGRRITGEYGPLEIVGVVRTAKSRTIGEPPRPTIYLSILDLYSAAQAPNGVTLAVKPREAGVASAEPFRQLIHRIDPGIAVFDVRTLRRHLDQAMLMPRLAGLLSAIAGGIALVVATIGVYGVISFGVARRRRELGIRLAIGARPREIVAMIVKQGLTLACLGIALGSLAALAVTRFAESLLYGVTPTDPVTFAVVPVFFMAVALAACLLPARAASRVDPVEVLRSE